MPMVSPTEQMVKWTWKAMSMGWATLNEQMSMLMDWTTLGGMGEIGWATLTGQRETLMEWVMRTEQMVMSMGWATLIALKERAMASRIWTGMVMQ
jgi:hypothetical protein